MERPKYDGQGLPPVGCVCLCKKREECGYGHDVKIVAHTIVAGKKAAVWQFGFDFGYGLESDFEIDPEQEES